MNIKSLVYGLIGIGLCLTSALVPGQVAGWTSQRHLHQTLADTALWEAQQFANASIQQSHFPDKWGYETGVVWQGMAALWLLTADGRYFQYIQHGLDQYISTDGTICSYRPADFKLDDLNNGRALLLMADVTGIARYRLAAARLWDQLQHQPRNASGGFWHKQIYPHQMWVDGLYMAEPFYLQYIMHLKDSQSMSRQLADIAHQFLLVRDHLLDTATGLYFHAWDASHREQWADPHTGRSANIWGRGDGWLAMALVDVLEHYPHHLPAYDSLKQMFSHLAKAIVRAQDSVSGCWYQLMAKPQLPGNYLESSATAMFIYALAKGIRLGLLPELPYRVAVERAYRGMLKQFVRSTPQGPELGGICSVAGLGGKPYRDGSEAYYLSEKVVSNDPKGVGAFLLASVEMAKLPLYQKGKNITIALDHYFNREWRPDPFGAPGAREPFHYLWSDWQNSGFSFWGQQFLDRGAQLVTIERAPTSQTLRRVQVYIIVDPDTRAETSSPHYIDRTSIRLIRQWVHNGGILLLMANDSGNCEFDHLNALSASFGIHFNENSRNHVPDHDYQAGALHTPADDIFPLSRRLFMKEICTLGVKPPARAELIDHGDIIIARAKYGRGWVLAVGDPWLYNEYTDGRKLPNDFENALAGADLADWLLTQAQQIWQTINNRN
ncbi:MAG: glycoside hydrolase family 88 protein [Thermoflavifilum sp.]|nr:glycoside hydrolase family 88 protein [Thermoflavifilum sp.]